MTLTVSAVIVLGIAAFFLLKSHAISIGPGLVVFLFGFFVAGTGAYQPIHDLVASIAQAVANLRT